MKFGLTTMLPAALIFIATDSCLLSQEKPAEKLRTVVNRAEATFENLAVRYRMQSDRVGKDDGEPRTVEQNFFLAQTERPKHDDAGKLFGLRSYNAIDAASMSNPGLPSESFEMRKLYARMGDRVFVSSETSDIALQAKELTSRMKDPDFANNVNYRYADLIKQNPLAMPFLTADGLHLQRLDFPAIYSRFTICKFSFAEDDRTTIWENTSQGVVILVKLSKEFDDLPVLTEFYKRPQSNQALTKGEKLGKLLYRTRTQWSKLDSNDQLASSREEKALPWLPRKVVFEQFPRDSDPTYFSLEMLAAWARIDDPNLISEETIMKKVEPDPIAKLYDRLDEKLSIIIAEEEKKMQRSKR